MLRLGDLTEGPSALLRWDSSPAPDRLLARVVRCPGGMSQGRTAKGLLVVTAQELAAMGPLPSDAVGVVVAGPDPQPVVDGVPVLRPAEAGVDVDVLALRLQSHALEVAQESVRWVERVLETTAGALESGEGPRRLLEFVEQLLRRVGRYPAQVKLIPGSEPWPEPLAEREEALRGLVEKGRGRGEVPVQWRAGDGRAVLVWPVGPRAPHQLLVVTREGPAWPAPEQRRLSQLVRLVEAVVRISGVGAREERLRGATDAVGAAGLRALMSGQEEVARELLSGLAPMLFAPHRGLCVAVVRVGPSGLAGARGDLEAGVGSFGVVVPEEGSGGLVVLGARSVEGMRGLLEEVVARGEGRVAGVGPVGRRRQAAQLYGLAVRQVQAAAALGPGSVLVHSGQRDLPERLEGAARVWARRLVAPLAGRPQLVAACRAAAARGVSGAGVLLGVHRQTVASRLEEAYALCGLERGRLAHRVVLDLALRLSDLPPPDAGVVLPAGVGAVLESAAAQEWGWELLEELPAPLLAALVSVVESGSVVKAAGRLGLSPRAVRARVEQASSWLHLPLATPQERPGAWHEVAWALHATGRIALDLPR